MDKSEHGRKRLCKIQPKSKKMTSRRQYEGSAVKPEPELKNTVGCNLYPSDGPGKPNRYQSEDFYVSNVDSTSTDEESFSSNGCEYVEDHIPHILSRLLEGDGDWSARIVKALSGYHQKDRKPSQNDKTGAGMEHDCAKSSQSSQKMTSQMSLWKKSAVKPEPELKNTIECNLYPSDGPGKPNSIFMKTVKTKMGPQSITTPFVVQIDKGHVRLKAQS
ncbi:hypothetical protein Tco_1359310 [Tanacetum coccineum]